MKKWFGSFYRTAAAAAAALVVTAFAAMPSVPVLAEEETEIETEKSTLSYTVGDEMQDFTFTDSEGNEYSYVELAEEYDAVVLNFWYTTCVYCDKEFPYMEEAYEEYQDQIAVIAFTPYDENDAIVEYKEETGLTFLMAEDVGLDDAFGIEGYPTTVVIDRYGVICFLEAGMQPSADAFRSLFAAFSAEDYTESLIGFEIPSAMPDIEMPDAEEVAAALNVEGGELTFFAAEDEYSWPWLPDEDEDRSFVYAGNTGTNDSYADICTTVTVSAGDVLAFDYRVSCDTDYAYFYVTVNEEVIKIISAETDWTSYAYLFEEDGEYTITFTYSNSVVGGGGDDIACIDNVRVLSGDEAEEALAANPVALATLEGEELTITVTSENAKEVVIDDPSGSLDAYYGEDAVYYIITDETADFRIEIGADLDPDALCAFSYYDGSINVLSQCETDEEGYLVSSGIDSIPSTGYSWTSLEVYRILVDDYETCAIAVFFASEENLNYLTTVSFYDEEDESTWDITWSYADGTLPSTDALPEEDSGEEADAAEVSYTLSFVDQNGDPVAGVIANVCDENTCDPKTSAEDGIISFTAAPYPYAIHIISIPDGYEFDLTQEFTASEEGGEMSFTITKAE